MVNGTKPNLQQIVPHVFGCPVSVLNFNKKRTDGKLAAFPSIYFGVDPIRPESSQVLNESGNQLISSNEVKYNEDCDWLRYDPTAPFSPLNRPPKSTTYPAEIAEIESNFD